MTDREEGMENIRTERDGAVGIITIDRPDRFNSLDVGTARDFRRAGLRYARDEEVSAVVVRGSGPAFCSGADLKYVRDHGDDEDFGYLQPDGVGAEEGGYGRAFKEILEYIHSAISEIKRAPKPFVAAVDGMAAAGGFGIAMACDLVFASEDARFEWAYHKTGLTGAESSTFFLPRLLGLRKALELVFMNPRLDAGEAADAGLVNRVWPAEEFEERWRHEARKLADGPTEAYAVAKRLVHQAVGIEQLDVHLDDELENLSRIADGADFAEGLEAFFEKRRPEFGGGR